MTFLFVILVEISYVIRVIVKPYTVSAVFQKILNVFGGERQVQFRGNVAYMNRARMCKDW